MTTTRAAPRMSSKSHEPGRRAVVIGGGIAGLAAATTLAERGVAVTVLEREPQLGGRVASWPITLPDGTRLLMERGFHAFFRQYSYLRGLMRRWDPTLQHLVPLVDYPILGPAGDLMRFDKLPKRAPWNVAAVALRGRRWMTLEDLTRIDVRRALAMLTGKDLARFDGESAKDYLDGLRFPPEARRMLFDVFAHSFFNPEEEMSAAELLMMFRFYFTANPEGLVFDVLDDAFGTSFMAPWAAYLERLGVELHTSRPALAIQRDATGRHRFAVETRDEALAADLVVLATEVPGLHALARTSDALQDAAPGGQSLAERLLDLQVTAPFAVWRLFLDRQPNAARDPFAGTAGLGRLDNISIYERFEAESRAYAKRTGHSVIELHAYGLDPIGETALKTELRAGLDRLYPELAGARVVHDEWLLRQDCPAFPVGSYTSRPTVRTSVPGLALAGDFVHLPFPSALMERAAGSGVLAAHTLLADDVERGATALLPILADIGNMRRV